jgi:hypothetical protein
MSLIIIVFDFGKNLTANSLKKISDMFSVTMLSDRPKTLFWFLQKCPTRFDRCRSFRVFPVYQSVRRWAWSLCNGRQIELSRSRGCHPSGPGPSSDRCRSPRCSPRKEQTLSMLFVLPVCSTIVSSTIVLI